MPQAALRHETAIPDAVVLTAIVEAAGLHQEDGRVTDRDAGSSLGRAEPAMQALQRRLRDAPFAAPDRTELADLNLGRRELAAATRSGRIMRLADDVVLLPDAVGVATEALRMLPQPFTLSAARRALATTRRVAVPLLEHLDALGVTERVDGQLRRIVTA
jgi:selenocysteine-specific elongation factor